MPLSVSYLLGLTRHSIYSGEVLEYARTQSWLGDDWNPILWLRTLCLLHRCSNDSIWIVLCRWAFNNWGRIFWFCSLQHTLLRLLEFYFQPWRVSICAVRPCKPYLSFAAYDNCNTVTYHLCSTSCLAVLLLTAGRRQLHRGYGRVLQ